MSAALPDTAQLSAEPLAAGIVGRLANGPRAWRLLCRMLLVPDGAVVRRRHHEPFLGSRSVAVCIAGVDDEDWERPWQSSGRRAECCRRSVDRDFDLKSQLEAQY